MTAPIPRGAYHGQVICLGGYGRPAIYNGPTGALILTIAVIPGELEEQAEEANVQRVVEEIENDRDIYLTVMISPLEARTGIKRVLTLPDGKQVTMPIPRGAYHGQVICLGGYGRPAIYNGATGALILTIAIILIEEGLLI